MPKLLGYLTFDAKKITGVRKSPPVLRQGEYAVKLVLEVPAGLFKSNPPVVTVTIAEQDVILPTITVETAQ